MKTALSGQMNWLAKPHFFPPCIKILPVKSSDNSPDAQNGTHFARQRQ